jgi:hypothetical protein
MTNIQVNRMFEPFSRGYYLGRLYVEPYDGEGPVMHRAAHERVNAQLYATGTGVERLDLPLVMKLGRTHLVVRGAADVPERTIALPAEWLDAIGIENPPTMREVLLAKREVAARLLDMGATVA